MSIESSVESQCEERAGTCSAIDLSILPKEHDLGGFSVRRVLPAVARRMIGPWVFFDHMGPAVFATGKGIDVRPHPHINLATVTYLFEGEMLHRDSLGNELTIIPGEINLMVAGKGIVHSERQREEIKAGNNKLEGLQLWLALPESEEEIDPEFHHYDASEIPTTVIDGVPVKILIGSAYHCTSPVKTFAKTLYLESRLKKGQTLELPDTVQERGVYVVRGGLTAKDTVLAEHSMTIFHPDHSVAVTAEQDTQLALVGGESLSHRYIWWNFVSSRKERIEQAKSDWKNGAFPKVYRDEAEFIPLPEK